MKPNWFVAIPVPGGPWFPVLLADLPTGVRPSHRLDLHITLAFLGPVSPAQARAGFEALPAECEGPLRVTLSRLRGMGNRRRPSAYALTLEEGREVVASRMARWRDDVFDAAGARPDTRKPLPHITVARPPRRASDALYADGQVWMRSKALSDSIALEHIALEHIALYTWSADRRARQFQIIEQRAL